MVSPGIFAAVAVYHQGHRRVYRPGSYDPIPMDRLAYGVMMNGDSNSSAAGLVAVRVPEDEKSWYGGQWCDPHHHCDRDVLAL